MSLKRVSILVSAFLCVVLAGSAQAQSRKWSLTGGGGQAHIGDGLMLPIQQAATTLTNTGAQFPNLRVPVVPGAVVSGTHLKPLKTAMATVNGPVTKQGYQRQLKVPMGVLAKPASFTVVGVKFSNPVVFAVASNVNYTWPAAAATFSTGNAGTAATIAGFGGSMTYSNTLGTRFGGAGQFRFTPGGPSGIIPPPITVYLKVNSATPACTHPLFGGPPATPLTTCIAGLIAGATPSRTTGTPMAPLPILFGAGGAQGGTVMTPGAPLAPNVAAVQLGTMPLGTIVRNTAGIPNAIPAATNPAVPTNMATSVQGPWTTGKLIVTNGLAGGQAEAFTLSGNDARTVSGGGTIQLVSGALSTRTASLANANRGWVQLDLQGFTDTPSLSPMGLAAMASLVLLAGGYAIRRRMFA